MFCSAELLLNVRVMYEATDGVLGHLWLRIGFTFIHTSDEDISDSIGLSTSHTLFFKFFFFFLFFSFFFFWGGAAPMAYGGPQARGRIGAVAAGLCHSHSSAGSEPHLQPTPQLTATLDP